MKSLQIYFVGVFLLVSCACLGLCSGRAILKSADANRVGTSTESTDKLSPRNGLLASPLEREQEDDGRIMEDDKEESITVKNTVISALDMLKEKGKNTASGVLGRQSETGESLFPTVLMETTIMRSDPPNFYRFLMEDYLKALVNYMLPSTFNVCVFVLYTHVVSSKLYAL